MTLTLTRRQFTVHDYARMRETGILTEDDRVELLDGAIYVMSPVGPLHVGLVNKLNKLLTRQVGDAGLVSIQNPIRLNNYSEPQPAIAILQPRDDYYTSALPAPDAVLLIIEIADSSLDYDRDEKLPRYAEANIREVWIIDVHKQIIEQYMQPLQNEYTRLHKMLFGNPITASSIPEVQLTTDQIF